MLAYRFWTPIILGLFASVGLTASDAQTKPLSYKRRGITRIAESKTNLPVLAERWMSVTLKTRDHEGQWRAVPNGSILYSGENMTLHVEMRKSAYIYVLYQTNDSPIQLLHPMRSDEHHPMPGLSEFRLPAPDSPDGDVFHLDGNPGLEKLYIIASASQQSLKVDQLKTILSGTKPRAIRKKGVAKKRKRKKHKTPRIMPEWGQAKRGRAKTRSSNATIDVVPDENGIAVLTLMVDHQVRE